MWWCLPYSCSWCSCRNPDRRRTTNAQRQIGRSGRYTGSPRHRVAAGAGQRHRPSHPRDGLRHRARDLGRNDHRGAQRRTLQGAARASANPTSGRPGVEHDVLNETASRDRVPGSRTEMPPSKLPTAGADLHGPNCHRSVAVDPSMCLKVPASNRPRGVAGMLKYVTKFAMDILPSVVATIIGAYIVNHYIVTKPDADAPPPRCPRPTPRRRDAKTDAKADAKLSASVVSNLPQPGVKAKGISEKAMHREDGCRKAGGGRKAQRRSPPTSRRRPPASRADTRRHAPAPREREKADRQARRGAAAHAGCGCRACRRRARCRPGCRGRGRAGRASRRQRTGARGDRAPARQRRRFAARRRKPPASRMRPASRSHPGRAAPVACSARRFGRCRRRSWSPRRRARLQCVRLRRRPAALCRRPADDPSRPTPPADIPLSSPRTARSACRGRGAVSARTHQTVAEDMLSAAKSVFHAVLPK